MHSRKISRPRTRVSLALACALMLLASTFPALGQSAANKAAAEALFDQGKLLMQSADYAKACEKFEASRKLDEGIGTLLYLADCYEKMGRTASAWAMFKEAASVAGAQGQESRQRLAAQRAKNLEPGLAKLTVEVAQGNESVLGFEVRNDGVTLPAAQYGSAVPIDPGEHRIEASAPGKRSHVDTIQAGKGAATRVVVPPLVDLAPGAGGDTPAIDASMGAQRIGEQGPTFGVKDAATGDPRKDAHSTDKIQRGVALALGGLGLVGVGFGSYFGLSAIDKNSKSKSECPSNPSLCSPEGVELRNDALDSAKWSTIAFAAGGAALAAGIVLYFAAPGGRSAEVALTTAPQASRAQLLTFRGRF